jgi:hypothetical protein
MPLLMTSVMVLNGDEINGRVGCLQRPLRRDEVIDVWMFDERLDAHDSVKSEGLGARAEEVCAE